MSLANLFKRPRKNRHQKLTARTRLRRSVVEALEDRRLLAANAFQLGINDNGNLGIRNTSTSTSGSCDNIPSLTIDFRPGNNQTFFDTSSASPGNASRGWSAPLSNPFSSNLPNNASTDGEQVATINFSGFGSNEDGRINFDLDAFDDIDGTGDAAGGRITVRFGSG